MKKFLDDYNFEYHFDENNLFRGKSYYLENRILDIWCQDNKVVAYINGSSIYKVKLTIDNKLKDYSCSCPYSLDGEYMCKHIASVLYYLKENYIPELEVINQKQVDENLELIKIYDEMENNLRHISDKNGFINYYNGRYFVDLISNVSDKIEDFIDNEEFEFAFELIKYTYNFIKDTSMDGSNGEYQQSFYLINKCASNLLYNDEYFNIFLDYTYDVANEDSLDDFSDAPLHAFILYVHDSDSALEVINILDDIELNSSGIFVSQILDKISLTYDYVNKEEAIKTCYKYIDYPGVKKLLIKYLEDDNKIDEIIKLLKDDLKNCVRKDVIYDKLLKIYDENNRFEDKIQLLPEVIIETHDFSKYIELKEMCSESEWIVLKEDIISKLKDNRRDILLDIYMEENEIDKLFDLIKQDISLYRLAKYQDILKDKYSEELLNLYKNELLEESKSATDRSRYEHLCRYIGKMSELSNSEDYIYNMLTQMYPSYKSRPAFKQEIIRVLSPRNKQRFYNLI